MIVYMCPSQPARARARVLTCGWQHGGAQAMEEIVNKTAAVIKKHSQPRTVAVYTTGAQVIGPLKGARYFNGNKWQVVNDRSWKIPGKGRYLLSATLRTIHKDGQSGFTKLYVRYAHASCCTAPCAPVLPLYQRKIPH